MPLPFFRPSSRPGQVQKPILKRPVSKPKPEVKPKGIFGEKKYRSFRDLRGFAIKAPYKKIPTYDTRLGKKERLGLVKELAVYGRKFLGRSHGLSDRDYSYIIKKVEKQRGRMQRHSKEWKELDKKVKTWGKWKEGF